MITTNYEEYLEKNGEMTYSNVGVSMLPLLKQERDLFTVKKKDSSRCSKYDVVLYRRPPSSYVLHRIIKVRENDYVILGDNCINKEYGITDDDIIGVMTGFVHNGKKYSTSNFGYLLYSRIWVFFSPVRIFFKRVKLKLKSVIKRILKI
mgnify:CR=1 FL=1